MSAQDINDVHRRFREVFGGDPNDHPLYSQMVNDLQTGRSKSSVLADLTEAESFRKKDQG